jgi:hypothetical protein
VEVFGINVGGMGAGIYREQLYVMIMYCGPYRAVFPRPPSIFGRISCIALHEINCIRQGWKEILGRHYYKGELVYEGDFAKNQYHGFGKLFGRVMWSMMVNSNTTTETDKESNIVR